MCTNEIILYSLRVIAASIFALLLFIVIIVSLPFLLLEFIGGHAFEFFNFISGKLERWTKELLHG